MKKNNDKYYRINLEGLNAPLSIHESRYLSSSDYHAIKTGKFNTYQILTEVEKNVGNRFYGLNMT